MAVLRSEVVPKNTGAAFEVTKGQRLRIAGKSIVDFAAFNLHDLTERFDQTVARGVDGTKCIASVECSHIEQKENSVQS